MGLSPTDGLDSTHELTGGMDSYGGSDRMVPLHIKAGLTERSDILTVMTVDPFYIKLYNSWGGKWTLPGT